MAFHSLHQFVQSLSRAGELERVSAPVDTELEITAIADAEMKKTAGGKALLFEKPVVNGQLSPFPLLINAWGSHRRMAMSLGVDSVDSVASDLASLLQAKPPTQFREAVRLLSMAFELRHAKSNHVKTGPCKDVLHRLEAASAAPVPAQFHPADGPPAAGPPASTPTPHSSPPTLLNLPILKCWPLDGGRFITLPCVVTRDPDTGARNLGMYRMQVYDPRTTGMHWQLHKVGARHCRRYAELGQRMPVAVFLGGDPVLTFCATAPLPDGLDEFMLAGYLRRKPVNLVSCETNDLEVPADADFVLEGYVDPQEKPRWEGPFGDHTGYYSMPDYYPAFHLTAITHRADAVFPATIVGRPPMEDFYIGSACARLVLPILKMNFPELVDIAFPAEGVFHNLVFVSIKKTYPWQAYKVMHGLWGMGQMSFSKYVIVVDEDVNVHNTSEVLFHLCANTDPQRDGLFTRGPADALDHATPEFALGSKLGIDATHKLPGEGFKREWPPLIRMDEAVQARIARFRPQ